MPQAALLEYFTSGDEVVIFVGRAFFDRPLAYTAWKCLGERPLTRFDLALCLQRLLIDFHGIPATATHDEVADALRLPPAVNLLKRRQGIQQINLPRPAFRYELDYLQSLSESLIPMDVRGLIEECDLLCVVPHGPLHGIPFAALKWDSDTYLYEKFGLCYLPSASVLRYCRQRNRARSIENTHHQRQALIVALAASDDVEPGDFEATPANN